MYLPREIENARVLITVKTYPNPSSKYKELVCTAGLLNGERWIRIYPIAYRFLSNDKQYPKYGWVELNLTRRSEDFRPESYRPKSGVDENIKLVGKIDTKRKWAQRKKYVLREEFYSMEELIKLAKSDKNKSLATLKPSEIIDFICEPVEREWKDKWLALSKQGNIFGIGKNNDSKTTPKLIPKLPFKYSYKFISEGDQQSRKMMIEDWEIGALFWNCLRQSDGDEIRANQLVRNKYFDTFTTKNDLYFFLGTTQKYHNRSRDPFTIVGVFYPPKDDQFSLFPV